MNVTIDIPEEVLNSARMTAAELKVEIAIYLYAQGRLSIGKARELADLPLLQFRQLLTARQIPVHFDESDFADDMATLRKLGRA